MGAVVCGGCHPNRAGGDSGQPPDVAVAAVDLSSSADLASTTDDLATTPDLVVVAATCGTRGSAPCPAGQFCEFAGGGCGATDQGGTCLMQPSNCNGAGGAPACGCDGKDYANDCLRQLAGTALAHSGRCDNGCTSDAQCPPGLLCCYPCGIPGCTNKCLMPAADGRCPLFP